MDNRSITLPLTVRAEGARATSRLEHFVYWSLFDFVECCLHLAYGPLIIQFLRPLRTNLMAQLLVADLKLVGVVVVISIDFFLLFVW